MVCAQLVKSQQRGLDNKCERLETKLQKDMGNLEAKCHGDVDTLGEQLRNTEAELMERIEQRASRASMDEWLSTLERRVSDSQTQSEHALKTMREEAHRHEQSLVANVESNLGSLESKLNSAVKSMGAREAALISTMTDNLRSIEQDAQTRRAELKQARLTPLLVS